MTITVYIASALLVSYILAAMLNKELFLPIKLDHTKPFYNNIWFILACILPISFWIAYSTKYAENNSIEISSWFTFLSFIFEHNYKSGIGLASLSLLLGVMVARFHSSKQNSERIKMTLDTTRYSNAFSHRKEFGEYITKDITNPFKPEEVNINSSKLHSYFFRKLSRDASEVCK